MRSTASYYAERAFLSFISAFALVRLSGISSFNPAGLIMFIGLLGIYTNFVYYQRRCIDTDALRYSAFSAAIFSLLTVIPAYEVLLKDVESGLFAFIILVLSLAGFFCIYYVGCFVFFTMDFYDFIKENEYRNTGHLAVIAFVMCMLFWMPYFLNNYPAIMTVDSLNQYGQLIGALPLSTHHPLVHTFMIGLFRHLGLLLLNSEIHGLAMYTLFQMTVMALVFSGLVKTLAEYGFRTGFCLAVTLFYAALPITAIYMVTMWKDILFSGFTLLYSLVIFRMLAVKHHREKYKLSDMILFVISAFFMCTLRSNGLLAVALTFVLLLIFHCKKLVNSVLIAVVIVSVAVFNGPVTDSLDAQHGDFVEALSIPIQMMARVYADGESVDYEDDAEWNKIVDTSKISETYVSTCSDHMKNLIRMGNQSFLEQNKLYYLKLWFDFGLKHPVSYLKGYIDTTRGYYYPDAGGADGGDELIAHNDYGLDASPIFRSPVTVKIKEIVFKLEYMFPVYGMLFSAGFYTWAAMLLAIRCLKNKSHKRLLVFAPNAAVLLTLLAATPVYNEFRYGLPLLLSLPLFIMAASPES